MNYSYWITTKISIVNYYCIYLYPHNKCGVGIWRTQTHTFRGAHASVLGCTMYEDIRHYIEIKFGVNMVFGLISNNILRLFTTSCFAKNSNNIPSMI